LQKLPSHHFEGLQDLAAEEEILVVDDDPRVCQSIQLVLTSVGLRASVVHSVAAAKQALGQNSFSLVLLDLGMPEVEGSELLRHINHEQIDSCVIVVSGESDIQKAVDVFKLGARDFIRKPYNPEELLLAIKNTLRNRKLEIQNRYLADELQSSEMQRLQLQKIESVGRLAGGVAHDFNNMLSAILGYTELALLEVNEESLAGKFLLKIQDAAQHSATLTSQLLGFARKQPIAPQVLVLSQAVKELIHILRQLIGEDIELRWRPAAKKAKVLIDPSQLNQILTNLIVNARDAIATTGTIEISTECISVDDKNCLEYPWCQLGNYVLLKVSDDGCGMSPEIQEHIFEPFFTTKEMDKGTGLGLATVYGIVKQNHGCINVYSEPDQGTTIHICLPRSEEDPHAASDGAPDLSAGGDETILLVEDDSMLLELWQTILEGAGYQVMASTHPEEALALVKGEHIDLLLTDVIMPRLNGKELADRLMATRPGLKVIYMSGYEASIIASRGLLEESVELLSKPLKHVELLSKVREVLGGDN